MGLYAFGFHKFYSIIIRYIGLITAIDIQTLHNFSHKLSFALFYNLSQFISTHSQLIRNSSQHMHIPFFDNLISQTGSSMYKSTQTPLRAHIPSCLLKC